MESQPTDDLEAAFVRLRQGLREYLRRRVHDAETADDLLQDVCVKALAAEDAGRRIDNLTGWLYATVRTTLVDHYRAAGEPMLELDENMPNREVDDLSSHQELANCLRPFIDRLRPIYRDTLVAIDLDGTTMRSHAHAQHVSTSAIKSRAARARALLKTELLACCRVEIVDGVVTDYARVSDRCGNPASVDSDRSVPRQMQREMDRCC